MCRHIHVRIKNSTRLPTGSLRTSTITPFAVILGMDTFARICGVPMTSTSVSIIIVIIINNNNDDNNYNIDNDINNKVQKI